MRENTINEITKNKIIVILRNVPEEKLIPLAEALYKGGIRLIEITFDQTKKVSENETAAMIKKLTEHFMGKLLVGAGTVLSEKQVELTKEAGGLYIISPDSSEKVIKKTRQLGLVSIPGAMTPTEIVSAYNWGGDFIKIFPLGNLGISYLKAVMAPLKHIPLLAVGGVNVDNVGEFMEAGIKGIGISSNIIKKDYLNNNEFDKIEKLAEEFVKKTV